MTQHPAAIIFFLFFLLLSTRSLSEATPSAHPTQTITDVAGKNETQTTARSVSMNYISDLMSPSMATMYIAFENSIAKVDRRTQQVEIIAGRYSNTGFKGEDDLAENSVLGHPRGLVQTKYGTIYFCDSMNHVIRKITRAGIISTFLGIPQFGDTSYQPTGEKAKVSLNNPRGIVLQTNDHGEETHMYVADTGNNCIRRVEVATHKIETVAGMCGSVGNFSGDGGIATAAALNEPTSIVVNGNDLIIADYGNGRIRRVRNGKITTIAGTGNFNYNDVIDGQLAVEADIQPQNVAMFGGEIYFSGNPRKIMKIIGNGTLVTVAGNGIDFNVKGGELATNVGIGIISGLIVTEKEMLFASKSNVLSVSRQDGIISIIAGTSSSNFIGDGGMANRALLDRPSKVFLGDGHMLVAEQYGRRIRKIFNNGTIITVAGGENDFWKDGKVNIGDGGLATDASLDFTLDVFEWDGEIYIADTYHHLIRKVDRNGIITTIAGNNEAPFMDNVAANMTMLYIPHAIRMDLNGELIISDTFNHRIRKVLKNNTIITIAGNGFEGYNGEAMDALKTMLSFPKGLFVTSENEILFADSGNGLIRKICKDGKVINVAGNGIFGFSGDNEKAIESQLYEPTDVIMNSHGDMFIADSKNSKIRKVSRNGTITSIAGTGVSGYYQGNGNAILSKFNMPTCLAERNDEIYVCDSYNNLIRKISPSCQQGWIYDQSTQMCLPMCFGFVNGNEKVCSGNGYCMTNDVCKCDRLYFGLNCETSLLVVMIPILGGITGLSMLVICIVVLWYFYKNKKWIQRKRKENELDQKLLDYNDGSFSHDESKIGSSHIIPIEDIEFIKKIGEGGFGTVFKANWNKTIVAVKSISTSDANSEEMEEFEKEAMLLNSLKHPNILSFFGICLSASKNLLVMEYLEEGSLDSLIQEWKMGRKKCKLDQKLKYMIDIANGMSYLHNLQPHPIIHRDLKPANILLNSSGQCKVCDFGMSRICSNKTATNLTCNIGTFFYMPNVSNDGMAMILI